MKELRRGGRNIEHNLLPTQATAATMLEFRYVGKNFPGVQALRDVSFSVDTGEVHALVGENGAGKSTLMKIVSGVYTDYHGTLFLEGRPLTLCGPQDARRYGIAIIHQELNLIPELTVAETLFLGREPRTRWGTLDSRRMKREASTVLERVSLPVSPDCPVKRLRVGEQQLVEIARALEQGEHPLRLLILDEPTSALSAAEAERLFEVIGDLKRQGVASIYISHKFDEIFRLADRITVLRDGAYIGTYPTGEMNESALIRLMVGRPLTDLLPPQTANPGEEAMRVEGLSLLTNGTGYGRGLDNISFSLRRGEILGVAGLMGAGRTELLETLFGVYGRGQVRGRIFIAGRKRHIGSPQEAIAAGLAFVTEDRKTQSLISILSVRHNMTLAALKGFLRAGVIQQPAERAAVQEQVERLRIKTPGDAVTVGTLSGGNQQKVALAKCLLTAPSVLLLDEPTRGIDVGAKAEIYRLIHELAEGGAAILLASSEMPEILSLCDRVLVLSHGRLTAELTQAEATQERILEAATLRRATRDAA